jgi:hypothetical protein
LDTNQPRFRSRIVVAGADRLANDGRRVRLAPRQAGQEHAKLPASIVLAVGDGPAVLDLGHGAAVHEPSMHEEP